MTDPAPDSSKERSAGEVPDSIGERQLTDEDQARVDGFLKRGVNSVERKPFRPILLLVVLIVVVMGLSFLSQGLAHVAGVY